MPYVLNADHSTEPMDDIVEWSRRFELDDRIVAQTQIGHVLVSTVFLGIAHGHDAQGRPLLFETMVFKGPMDGRQWRWATYKEAQEGHKRVLDEAYAADAAGA